MMMMMMMMMIGIFEVAFVRALLWANVWLW